MLICFLGGYPQISWRKMTCKKNKRKNICDDEPHTYSSLNLETVSQVWFREVKPKQSTVGLLNRGGREQSSRILVQVGLARQYRGRKEGTVRGWGSPRILDRGIISSHSEWNFTRPNRKELLQNEEVTLVRRLWHSDPFESRNSKTFHWNKRQTTA